MSREIKFRGQDKYGVWVYGSLVNNLWANNETKEQLCEIVTTGRNYYDCWEDMIENENIVEVIPETVGQYTGLKDKEEKEIYKGDVLKIYAGHPDMTKLNFEVIFHLGAFCMKPINYDLNNQQPVSFACYADQCENNGFERDISKYLEKIGSIYENQELLNQSK